MRCISLRFTYFLTVHSAGGHNIISVTLNLLSIPKNAAFQRIVSGHYQHCTSTLT